MIDSNKFPNLSRDLVKEAIRLKIKNDFNSFTNLNSYKNILIYVLSNIKSSSTLNEISNMVAKINAVIFD